MKIYKWESIRLKPEGWSAPFPVKLVKPEGGEIGFITRRTPTQNFNVDKRYLAGILWKDERLAILNKYALGNGMEYKKKVLLLDKLCEHLSLVEMRREVMDILKHRKWDDKRVGIEIVK